MMMAKSGKNAASPTPTSHLCNSVNAASPLYPMWLRVSLALTITTVLTTIVYVGLRLDKSQKELQLELHKNQVELSKSQLEVQTLKTQLDALQTLTNDLAAQTAKKHAELEGSSRSLVDWVVKHYADQITQVRADNGKLLGDLQTALQSRIGNVETALHEVNGRLSSSQSDGAKALGDVQTALQARMANLETALHGVNGQLSSTQSTIDSHVLRLDKARISNDGLHSDLHWQLVGFRSDVLDLQRLHSGVNSVLRSWVLPALQSWPAVSDDLLNFFNLTVPATRCPKPEFEPAMFSGFVHLSHHKAGTHWADAIVADALKPLGVQMDAGFPCALARTPAAGAAVQRLVSCLGDRSRGDDDDDRGTRCQRQLANAGIASESRAQQIGWFDVWNPDPDFQQYWRSIAKPRGRMTQIIRDLRDVSVSGYFYHLKATEEWLLYGYQSLLRSLPMEQALLVEMHRVHALSARTLGRFNLSDPHFFTMRYEDVWEDPSGFLDLFRAYGLRITQSMRDAVAKNSNKTNFAAANTVRRKGQPGDWKRYLTGSLKEVARKLFGNWLIKYGYEKDLNW